jgi:hypothetical protein
LIINTYANTSLFTIDSYITIAIGLFGCFSVM